MSRCYTSTALVACSEASFKEAANDLQATNGRVQQPIARSSLRCIGHVRNLPRTRTTAGSAEIKLRKKRITFSS
jgi:hypothetical protein